MVEAGTFNGTGADASGSDGDSNRVLTLLNTEITFQNGFLVYASGLPLALTVEYTVVHNTTGTEITFLNGLWDDMTLIVNYFQSSTPGIGSDFTNGPLVDFGIIAVRTPVTKTTTFSGQKEYTDGTDENISMVWDPYTQKHDLDKAGLTKVYDIRVFIGPSVTLNKYHKITYQSKVYRVEEVSIRNFNGTVSFQVVGLFYIADA